VCGWGATIVLHPVNATNPTATKERFMVIASLLPFRLRRVRDGYFAPVCITGITER
jgi:hypothetical protein